MIPDKEGRNAFVKAAVQKFYDKSPKPTAHDILHKKVCDVTEKLRQFVKPILAAGGWKDEPALYDMIFKCYYEAFDTKAAFSHDELAVVLAQLHTEIMMETIKASPFGSDKPDEMGGV